MNTPDSFVTLSGSATFAVLSSGRSRATTAQVTVQKMPWSSASVLWLGGKSPRTLNLSLYVANGTQMANLESLCNSFGTLTDAEGSFPCVLESVTSGDYSPSGEQMVSARFTVTT